MKRFFRSKSFYYLCLTLPGSALVFINHPELPIRVTYGIVYFLFVGFLFWYFAWENQQ